MAPRPTPFDDKVDRSGDHHVWTGARKQDGTGLVRIDGRLLMARHVAWERTHGPVPEGWRVAACTDRACVRADHLKLVPAHRSTPRRKRGPKGGGTRVQIRPGMWKLTVSVGRYDDGSARRLHRNVEVDDDAAAADAQRGFAHEVRNSPLLYKKADRDLTVDDAVERFLDFLQDEKGRDPRTVEDYRKLHQKWFAPHIGNRRLRDIDEATIDEQFARMRAAGLSQSRMNQARSLYGPLFRWGLRRKLVMRNVMLGFELPTSTHVAQELTAPEAEEVSCLLNSAVEVVPDIAPVLTLDAVTGLRRGELGTIRRTDLRPKKLEILVQSAASGARVKATKTRKVRAVAVAQPTMDMVKRHCALMDDRAAANAVAIAPDAFVFSLAPDCSAPMLPDHITKRVAVLKEHLGIDNKSPEVIAREDEALRLYRQKPAQRPTGRRGPNPAGGLSYREIGEHLERSARWAAMAVASAQRREQVAVRPPIELFDGSISALRKFTASELLDNGFNIATVSARQGSGPQVVAKHYSKRRRSSDRKAAEHLGNLIHQNRPVEEAPGATTR